MIALRCNNKFPELHYQYMYNLTIPPLHFSNPKIIHSFKTALACLIGYFLVRWTPLPQSQWIVITILVVMSAQPSVGSLFVKAKMRFWGTVFGALASAIIILLCHNNYLGLAVAIFIFTAVFSYIASIPGDVSYVGTLGSVTVIIIILSENPTLTIAGQRFIEIFLGIAISFLVSQFVFPIRSHNMFLKSLGSTLLDLHEYFEHCFETNAAELDADLIDMNDKILVTFSQQRRFIQETGLELGKLRKDKTVFQTILHTEGKIYQAINTIYHGFHANLESKALIQSLTGFNRFKQEMSLFLLQLSQAVRSGAVKEIRFLIAESADFMENDFRKITSTIEYSHIEGVHTFLFGVKFLLKELKSFTGTISKIHYSRFSR